MKASKSRLGAQIAGCLLIAAAVALGQGSLTPPGPPGPTMKTLTQVEPRTLISSVPYLITNSGSYYLTSDLVGTASQNGIVISVGNVSVDLKGFSVAGCSNGIVASVTGLSGVAVRNGTVRQCAAAGISLGGVGNCEIDHVLASANGGNGISAGAASEVDLCIASGNTGAGISVDTGSTVFDCVVQSNSADGILVTARCRVTGNTCDANGSGAAYAGVHVTGGGGRFEANNLSANNGSGIKVDGTNNLVIKNSACSNSSTDYNIAAGNSYGQILAALGAGFTNSNPWANFSCLTPPASCTTDSDCATNQYCSANVCTPKEANGLACVGSDQCLSGNCTAGICQTNANPCADGIKDGAETDIDCGGGTCSPCALGKTCAVGSDCTSGVCSGSVCVNATCSDGIKDGAETDIDCGGGTCSACATGKNCNLGGDCASGACCGGVCRNETTDVNNCGSCGNTCPFGPNMTPTCTGGTCGGVCGSGFGDCDHNPNDGCEVNLNTSINNCGSCGFACNSINNTPSCTGGVCSGVCNAGFGNCDNNLQANGCEVNLNTSAANCGACGSACSAINIATPTCTAGNCNGACNAGYADCDANKRSNGCETSIGTDPNNCGGCGVVCSSNHIVATACTSGSCSGACTTGFADCNLNKQTDGCEVNLTNDKNNCGSCGHVCTGVQNCVSSVCQ